MSTSLPIKNQIQPPLQASKWLSYPLLIDAEEMQSLLSELGEYEIFLVSGVALEGEEVLSREAFLDCYRQYIEALSEGKMPQDSRMRSYFSSVFTVAPDALYAFPLEERQRLVKVQKPVIQLQPHKFDYSPVDGKFRSMVFGLNSIHWGIQFSYPQLYQDEHMQIKRVVEGIEFPNTALFKRLQRWGRQHTLATPFLVTATQQRTNVPIRLGKQCFKWINNHPQLTERGLQVYSSSSSQ